jgi:hypothetical protein
MNKCGALILLACAFAVLTAERVEAAPVTWDFFSTSCSTLSGIGCDPKQQYPVELASLTFSGPDSAGSAKWFGPFSTRPTYTGDSFSFSFANVRPLTPAFPGDRDCFGPASICDFDLSWSEVGGSLTSISITVDGFNDSIRGFLAGADIGSDDTYGGCTFGRCRVTGYWQSDLAVPEPLPEPISAVLLITGLLGTCLASRSALNA